MASLSDSKDVSILSSSHSLSQELAWHIEIRAALQYRACPKSFLVQVRESDIHGRTHPHL